ncbi:neutral trehalase [Zymobacter palmae]|uniref:Neutral trehalase n=1 Tax=Zymobacter palmae TaxID=33074 RepID=A0A348HH93_9GAMM|nr:neutral trehalase [Zymobacter palmae]
MAFIAFHLAQFFARQTSFWVIFAKELDKLSHLPLSTAKYRNDRLSPPLQALLAHSL